MTDSLLENPIITILMERDGTSYEDAAAMLDDAYERVRSGANPEEILRDEFGLEPDYLFDLVPF